MLLVQIAVGGRRGESLQNSVHLPDEGHPDIKGSLSYHTAKLEVVRQVVVLAARNTREEGLLGVFCLVGRWRLGVRRLLEGVALGDVLVLGTGHSEVYFLKVP